MMFILIFFFSFLIPLAGWCGSIKTKEESKEEEWMTDTLYDKAGKQVTAHLMYLGKHLKLRFFYNYNEKNKLVLETIDNGTTEDSQDMTGVTERLITRYSYDSQGHLKKVEDSLLDFKTGEEKFLQEENHHYQENQLAVSEFFNHKGSTTSIQYENGQIKQISKVDSQGTFDIMDYLYDVRQRVVAVTNTTEDQQVCVEYDYAQNGQVNIQMHGLDGKNCKNNWFLSNVRTSWQQFQEFMKFISNKLCYYIEKLIEHKNNNAFLSSMPEKFELIAETLLGKSIFQMTGYYVQPIRHGVHGEREAGDKIRITLINGIMNYPTDHAENLEMFGKNHSRVNIHYLFRPCDGWTKDMLRCLITKCGYVSFQAHKLAKIWKDLIAEMGGVNGGGLIIHYAHSIGGTDTSTARTLLTPEEQKMIRVYTFGSPTLIPNEGFLSVVNYVSRRDGVCLLDPINYARSLCQDTNVIFLDTYLGTPLVDHTLTTKTYSSILEELGREFVKTYVKDKETHETRPQLCDKGT